MKIIVECPFCHKETLVLTWPAHTELRSRSAVAKSTTAVKRPEGFELISEKCSNCGQTANADKKRKRLEELKKLGFSGVIRG